jgi:hypothetical protein
LPIVGDPVENVLASVTVRGGEKSLQIDPAQDVPRLGRDPRDPVLLPDVGVDLALDVLELVQVRDRFSLVGHGESPHFAEGARVPVVQGGGAVAHDEAAPVMGHAPALDAVVELLEESESLPVVDEPDARRPGELVDAISEDRDPLAEILGKELRPLENASGLDVHFPEARAAAKPRALVENPVEVDQPLGEGGAVVGIGFLDLVGVHGRRREQQHKRYNHSRS